MRPSDFHLYAKEQEMQDAESQALKDFIARGAALEAAFLGMAQALAALNAQAQSVLATLRAGEPSAAEHPAQESPGDSYMLSPAESRAAVKALRALGGPVKPGAVLVEREDQEAFVKWNADLILKPTILDRMGATKTAAIGVLSDALKQPETIAAIQQAATDDALTGLAGMGEPLMRGMYWTDERPDGRMPLKAQD